MEEIQVLNKLPSRRLKTNFLSSESFRFFIYSIFLISVCVSNLGCSNKKVFEDDDARFQDINEEFSKVAKVSTLPADSKKSSAVSQPQFEGIAPKPELQNGKPVLPGGPQMTKPQEPSIKSGDSKIKSEVATRKSKTEVTSQNESMKKQTPQTVTKAEVKVKEKQSSAPTIPSVLQNRRPLIDPFRENEKVVLSVNYFNMEAGDLSMGVGPYKTVNGRRSYSFVMEVLTNKMFSMFYRVRNTAETLVDFDSLVPLTYSSQSNEGERRKEVRVYFDWDKNQVTHWEKSIKGSGPEKKKKIEWAVEPFSQNFISALYYLRTYPLEPGQKYSFQVVDAGKNYVFHADVLRREKISTVVGELNTVVMKPTFELGDQFKPTGDNLVWITDDDRKFIVRVESKIKIGTLVGKLKSLDRGK